MAIRGGAASRYAAALFSIARERGTADAWAGELSRLAGVVADPTAMRVLTAPGVSLREKQRAIEAAGGPVSREVGSLLSLLLERKRIDQLPSLSDAFADLVREQKGIALATVATAVPLPEADRDSVGRWLATYLGRRVEVQYTVDPEIIGGLVARVGDELIDASVRGRLEALRKVLRGAG